MSTPEEAIVWRLRRLLPNVGLTIRDLSAVVQGCSGATLGSRQHSAYVSKILKDLEKRGVVRRMDEKTPVLWQLAPEAKQTAEDAGDKA